jgi:hypothetical protein
MNFHHPRVHYHHQTAAILLLCLLSTVFSQQSTIAGAPLNFSGQQDGQYQSGTYLAEQNALVAKGKTLELAPGSVLTFKQYAGLIVDGTLICKGSPDNPIIFTAASDQWNGITVSGTGSIEFDNVKLTSSVFGIKIDPLCAKAALGHTVFEDNLHADASIGDSTVSFPNGIAGNWSYAPRTLQISPVPANAMMSGNPLPPVSWNLPFRLGFGGLGIAGVVCWIIADQYVADYQKKFNASRATADADAYHDKRDNARAWRTVGISVFAAGLAGCTVTFLF